MNKDYKEVKHISKNADSEQMLEKKSIVPSNHSDILVPLNIYESVQIKEHLNKTNTS